MSADFTPIIPDPPAQPSKGNYTDLQPFRFWCQKVLPLVYDESLSYYEVLCKLVDYLNKTMEDVGVLHDDVDNMFASFQDLTNWTDQQIDAVVTAYGELQSYVNNYFDNLDVQQEINNKLNVMATDGSLSALVDPFVAPAVSAWLTEHVDPSTGYVIDDTLSIAGAAADAKATGDAISVLSDDISSIDDALDDLYIPSKNIYNPTTDRHGKNIVAGVVVDDSDIKISDYIYVGSGNKVTVPNINGTLTGVLRVFFYTDDDENAYSRALYVTDTPSETFTLAPTENYIVISMYEPSEPFMVNMGESLLPYTPYGSIQSGPTMTKVLEPINTEIGKIESRFEYVNLFNKETITENTYIQPANGIAVEGNGFFASDYIDISAYTSIKVSKTHLFALYKADKTYLSAPDNTNSINDDLTVAVTEASYIRFSTWDRYLNSAQIGENISASHYVPFGKFEMPDLILDPQQIIVDANGNGDYTSLTEAIYETVDDGVDVFVKAGTYDLVAEYVDLFGQSAVDNMADADDSTFNGFQYGLMLRNRKIEFASGSHVVCDWTGHTVDGTHRFSALAVCYNVEIVGLDLTATNTFYAIHDDYGLENAPYTVKYVNCTIKGITLVNGNCIGGGCKKYSTHIIHNCYFDNTAGNTAVRYHNTNAAGAEPKLFVSNSFFNSRLTFNYYGTQTSKMKAYVNNCKASAILKEQESQSYSTDNVELIKWLCEESA